MADVVDKKYIGSVAEIKTMTNTILCIGRISKIKDDDSIVIDSKSEEFPIIDYNTIVKISVRNSKLGSVFLMGRVYSSEEDMLVLQEITVISDNEKRDYFRVKYLEQASYYDKETAEFIDKLNFVDISLGGFMCRTTKQLKKYGNYAIELKIGEERYFLEFTVIREREYKEGKHVYGCAFVNMNSKIQDDLAQFIFAIQRENLSKIKRRF